jgi:hypothetical protein
LGGKEGRESYSELVLNNIDTINSAFNN